MKKMLLFLSLLLLLNIAELFSQRSLLQCIPSDAQGVIAIHPKSIDQKIAWSQLRSYEVVDNLSRELVGKLDVHQMDLVKAALLEPQKGGMDLSSNFYAFWNFEENQIFFNTVFKIKDPKSFKAFVDAFVGKEISTKLNKQGDYLTVIKDNFAFAWQKDHALICYGRFTDDSEYLEHDLNDPNSIDPKLETKKILEMHIGNWIQLTEDYSYASNPSFQAWEKDVRDVGYWFSYDVFMEHLLDQMYNDPYSYNNPYLSYLPLLSGFYQNMHVGSDFSLEKGAIVGQSKNYLPADLLELSQRSSARKINPKFLKYMDGENLIMYSALAVDPEGIYYGIRDLLIKKAGPQFGKVMKDLWGIMEIFSDEKASLNFVKGDFLFVLNDIREVEVTYTSYEYNEEQDTYIDVEKTRMSTRPQISMMFSYGKKEDMMKFIRIFKTLGFLKEEKKNNFVLKIPMTSEQVVLKLNKGVMVISNDVDHILSNKCYKRPDAKHKNFLKENTQITYIDFPKLIAALATDKAMFKKEEAAVANNLKDGLGDIWMRSKRPNSKNNYIEQDFYIELKNKEENALKQFMDFVNRLYLQSLKSS